MAGKKPVTFRAVSYMENGLGSSSWRVREEAEYQQVFTADHSWRFTQVSKTVHIPQSEQLEFDKKMMQNAGSALSNYLAGQADEGEIQNYDVQSMPKL